MKLLQDVYDDIISNDIPITFYNFKNDRKSVILKTKVDNNYYIYIDDKNIINSIDEKCTLAEEYAHYKTGTLYACDSKFETIDRLETKARKYQTKYLIPKNELKNAIFDGNYYYYELAEYFGVSEKLIIDALNIYGIEYEIELEEV